MRYSPYYNPITRTRTKRRHRSLRGLGATPELMPSVESVKNVAMTGAIAALSAVAVDYLFNAIKNKTDSTKNFLGLKIGSYEDYLARAALGIVGAIVYKKFIEKGRISKIDIATAIAIGPVIVSAYNIFEKVVKGPSAMTGLGYIQPVQKRSFTPALTSGPLGAQTFTRADTFQPQMAPIAGWGSY